MLKLNYQLLFAGVVLVFTFQNSPTNAAECLISVGFEHFPPYQYIDSNGRASGLDVEIFRVVAAKAKCRVEFTKAPFKRVLQEIQTGRMHAMAGYFNPKRAVFAHYTGPYRKDIKALYVRKGTNENVNDLQDFFSSGLRLGVVRGVFYGDTAMKLIKQFAAKKTVYVNFSNATNLKMTVAGRIDGLLVNPPVVVQLMRESNAVGEVELRSSVYRTDVHMLLSKASVKKEVVYAFDQAITALQKDRTVAAIIEKYSVPNDGGGS